MGVVRDGPRGSGAAAGRDPAELRSALGVPLGDEMLERALTHRSYAYENGGLPTNERLEFLGDSVLGVVVTDTLFRGYPDLPRPAGQAARRRRQHAALAEVARTHRTWAAYVRLAAARRPPAAGTSPPSSPTRSKR